MENTKQVVIHKRRIESPPSASKPACSPFLKQILLHDWWLIKADSDFPGKRLGIGGFTWKEGQGIRDFSSAPIVKRNDAVTLRTVDGLTVLVHGLVNRSRTLENGFTHEVCEHFRIGFPYYWEEFSAIRDSEEPTQSSSSDSHETSSGESDGTNMPSGNIFDEILMENHDDACTEEENTPTTIGMDSTSDLKIGGNDVGAAGRSGPLTRSRVRLSELVEA